MMTHDPIIIIVAVVVPLVITFVVLKNVRSAFGMSPEKQARPRTWSPPARRPGP